MTNTMRRIRAYKQGTRVRGESRTFQRIMLPHLVRGVRQSRRQIRVVKGFDQ